MSDDSNSAENSQAAVRKKILLVDDDREIVESMRIALDAWASRSSLPGTATRAWQWPSARTRTW